ncbi:MAG: hypothetical protein GX446_09535 [Chthonomonadales bacterium]|nr:hypothetical protein [Chthonomonadales bacterium]
MKRSGKDGRARVDNRAGSQSVPRAVRVLLWMTGLLALSVVGYRAYPLIAEPFRQAAVVERGNRRIERVALIKQREKETLRKQAELAETDEGKLRILRESGFVKKGQSRLMGDGVGAPPSER